MQRSYLNVNSMAIRVDNSQHSLFNQTGWQKVRLSERDDPLCENYHRYIRDKALNLSFMSGKCIATDLIKKSSLDLVKFLFIQEERDMVFSNASYQLWSVEKALIEESTGRVLVRSTVPEYRELGEYHKMFEIDRNDMSCKVVEDIKNAGDFRYTLFMFSTDEIYQRKIKEIIDGVL